MIFSAVRSRIHSNFISVVFRIAIEMIFVPAVTVSCSSLSCDSLFFGFIGIGRSHTGDMNNGEHKKIEHLKEFRSLFFHSFSSLSFLLTFKCNSHAWNASTKVNSLPSHSLFTQREREQEQLQVNTPPLSPPLALFFCFISEFYNSLMADACLR